MVSKASFQHHHTEEIFQIMELKTVHFHQNLFQLLLKRIQHQTKFQFQEFHKN